MTEKPAIHRTGHRGEEAAQRLVIERGWHIEGRRLRVRAGEIDILATRTSPAGEETFGLVVEVKTTRGSSGDPGERVDTAKRQRLFRIAAELVHSRGFAEVHVAVVAVHLTADGTTLTWRDIDPF